MYYDQVKDHFQEFLHYFFKENANDKIQNIPTILENSIGKEEELLEKLFEKYDVYGTTCINDFYEKKNRKSKINKIVPKKNKKWIWFLLIFLLLPFIWFFKDFFKPKETLFVIGNNANIRKEADLNSKSITLLPYGEKVFKIKKEGDWIKIGFQNEVSGEGFVYKNFIINKDTFNYINKILDNIWAKKNIMAHEKIALMTYFKENGREKNWKIIGFEKDDVECNYVRGNFSAGIINIIISNESKKYNRNFACIINNKYNSSKRKLVVFEFDEALKTKIVKDYDLKNYKKTSIKTKDDKLFLIKNKNPNKYSEIKYNSTDNNYVLPEKDFWENFINDASEFLKRNINLENLNF